MSQKIDVKMANEVRLPTGTSKKSAIGFDVSFINTPLGLLRIFETFLNLAGSISAFTTGVAHSDLGYFKFLGLTGFIFAFTTLLLRLLHMDEYIPHWLYVEIGFNVVWSLFYIIGSSIMTNWGANHTCCGCSFAAFFGFTVVLIYITDLVILLYKKKLSMNNTSPMTNGAAPQAAWTAESPPRY